MNTRQKIVLGGLGALTPVVMNLLVLDLQVLLVNFTLIALVGYVVRVLILFYLGGLVAFLHKDEKSPIKLFELGIVAPALVMGYLSASQVDVRTASPPHPSASLFTVPAAHAADPAPGAVKTFSLPNETPFQQFKRGLTGAKIDRLWFVIAGSHRTVEEAQRQAEQFARTQPGFRAEVYAPYGANSYYAVVIGANLTYEDAQRLRERAVAARLPKDTYLWTFAK